MKAVILGKIDTSTLQEDVYFVFQWCKTDKVKINQPSGVGEASLSGKIYNVWELETAKEYLTFLNKYYNFYEAFYSNTFLAVRCFLHFQNIWGILNVTSLF